MSLKLTAASFLAGVKQSGLIDSAKLDALLDALQRDGVDLADSTEIAAALVARQAITEWQSEKLLQGRHKGFILGRYRLLSLLGTGEMSAVYLAEHITMERRCAIKVLPAAKVKDTSYLGRFLREARAVAALNHPNIVKAYDVDHQAEGGTEIHFLVMEYVNGRNLGKLVAERGPLPFTEAADYIRQAADGLHHAHQNGLVHRDVKPDNLLIDGQGVVHLLDLGLARFFNANEEESLTIKHDEKVLGTADFLAPEQAIDSHSVDHRADIYSLGCTLYFVLTGHAPFTDGSLVQRLLAHQTRQPPSVKYDRPDAPDDLLEILERMMAKSADARYQTSAEVSQALSVWLIQHGPEAWRQANLPLVAALIRNGAPAPERSSDATNAPQAPVPQRAAEPQPARKPASSRSGESMPVVTVAPRLRPVAQPTPAAAATAEPAAGRRSGELPVRTAAPRRVTSASGPQRAMAARTKPAVPRDWERTFLVGAIGVVLILTIALGVWLVQAQSPSPLKAETTPNATAQPSTDSP